MQFKNKDLYRFHQQLQGADNDIMFWLLFSRIKEFRRNNQLRINTLLDKVEKLQKSFFQYGPDGRVIFVKTQVPNTEEFTDEPLIQDGKNYDDYIKAFNELMELDTTIVF